MLYFFAHVGNQLNLGDDGMFVIAPNKFIVGNLRGKQLKLCKGSKVHPKECHPNGLFDLIKGDIIDFTWGMTGTSSQTKIRYRGG